MQKNKYNYDKNTAARQPPVETLKNMTKNIDIYGTLKINTI